MIIKNISGSTQTIDIGTSVQTVLNNGLIAMEPGYRWQINGIYGSKFRVATAAEVGSAGTGIMSINADATSAQVIAAGTGISVATVAGTTTITNTVTDTGITQLTGDVTAWPGNGSQAATIANLAVTNAKVAAAAAIDYSKLAALTSGNILVGSAGNVATSVAMSGDATIDNTGAVTVSGATGAFTVGGALTNTAGTQAVTFYPIGSNPQALSGAGAINTTTYQTQFTSTATGNALTLASVTQVGQVKKISYIAEAAGADTGVITPTATVGFTTATLNSVGDYIVLSWAGAGWAIIEYVGATLA